MNKRIPIRKTYRRYQTLILAIVTFAVFVWAAIDVFGVEPAVMKALFIGALLFLLAIILAAVVGFIMLLFVKKARK